MAAYILTYDVGTTGVKTCLFDLQHKISLISSASCGYDLFTLENGGAEQDANQWWEAMCRTTKEIFKNSTITSQQVEGISFSSQMQGLVLVDKNGSALRRPMCYLDQRATNEIKLGLSHGLRVANANIFKLIKSLAITGAVPASVKDPVWKYKWVQNNEPNVFKNTYKWLDVKDYLIARLTGQFVMTEDTAWATLLCGIKNGVHWSNAMCKMLKVDKNHLPNIVKSTDLVGHVTAQAAKELGLMQGTAVFGGGGDASLISIGSGASSLNNTHIYSGTSGWVGTVTNKRVVDIRSMIATIVGAESGKYLYFAEMETSGKCLEWIKNHLALDETDIYLQENNIKNNYEMQHTSLYDYMMETIKEVPAGCKGVIFTPWLHGNRCPFEDPLARGMFFNIGLNTGKRQLIRAVLEGIFYHKRWMMESQDKKVKTSDPIRFVGGGAISGIACQMLADILGKTIQTVQNPQNVGAVGAAVVVGVGLKIIPSLSEASNYISVDRTFYPQKENKHIYDKNYKIFKSLYKDNKKSFAILNQ